MSNKQAEAAKEKALEERVMARVNDLIATKDKEIEILKEQLADPYKDDSGEGNPRQMLYKKGKGLKSAQQFDPSDVRAAKKAGWLEKPDCEPTKPNPAPGEVVNGKVFKG